MALISASRRTDIPAFFGPWLINRLRAGFCLVQNPFRVDLIRRVALNREAVDGLILWTRNPEPFFERLPELERTGIPFYFQMTLTAMPALLEPGLPPAPRLLAALERLSQLVGPRRLVWRFDPILVTSLTPPDEIAARFDGLAARLAGRVERVVVSLAQLYAKARRNMGKIPDIQAVDLQAPEQQSVAEDLLGRLAAMARRRGFRMLICAAGRDYNFLGISPGKCVDESILNDYYGLDLSFGKDQGQRPACGCAESVDIGAYDSCGHGCLYCYATRSQGAARARLARHDPAGPLLIGRPEEDGPEEPRRG